MVYNDDEGRIMEIRFLGYTLFKYENPAPEINPVTGKRVRVETETSTPLRHKELLKALNDIELRSRPHIKHRPPPQAKPRI